MILTPHLNRAKSSCSWQSLFRNAQKRARGVWSKQHRTGETLTSRKLAPQKLIFSKGTSKALKKNMWQLFLNLDVTFQCISWLETPVDHPEICGTDVPRAEAESFLQRTQLPSPGISPRNATCKVTGLHGSLKLAVVSNQILGLGWIHWFTVFAACPALKYLNGFK